MCATSTNSLASNNSQTVTLANAPRSRPAGIIVLAALLAAFALMATPLSAKEKKGAKATSDQPAASAAPATGQAAMPNAAMPAGAAAKGPAANMPKMPTTLTKTMALESLITGMAVNGSEDAQQTLEKVVTGEIAFGKHSRQAAQIALAQFVLHPWPRSNAFLMRMLTDPEDKLRVKDKTAYAPSALRADVVHMLAKAASPEFRLALAKLYTQADTPPATRSIIAEIVKSPGAANFAAQLEIANSPQTPPDVKQTLQLVILQKNASAVKQALKLEAAPALAAGGLGGGFPMPGGIPAGAMPAANRGGAGSGGGLMGGLAKLLGGGGPSKGASTATPANASAMKGGIAAGKGIPQPSAALKVPAGAQELSGGLPGGLPGGMPAMSAGMPAMPMLPPGAMAAQMSPTGMALEMVGQMLNLQPVDANAVARELWKPEFVKTLGEHLTSAKTGKGELITTLASVPVNSARNELKAYLHQSWQEGPQPLVNSEAESFSTSATPAAAASGASASATPAPAGGPATRSNPRSGFGGGNPAMDRLFASRRLERAINADIRPNRGRSGFGNPGANPGAAAPAGAGVAGGTPVANNALMDRMKTAMNGSTDKKGADSPDDVGAEWLDPGSLVVLKTVPYEERPKEKPVRKNAVQANNYGYSQLAMNQSPAAQKRAQEKAEKQKAAAIKYEWRDAVQKLVRHLSDRFDAVAQESSAADTTVAADDKADEKTDKPSNGDETKSKSSGKSTSSAGATSVSLGPAPKPSVAMPVALHPGGKIAKEFHVSWPEDLPGQMGATVTDPLVVHYVRLEGPGEYGKALSHYRSAVKAKNMLREIENGKWIDAVVKDDATHRTRSVDIMITREAADDDTAKKSKIEDLKIEILVVEIASLEADAPTPTKPKATKKASHETTGTNHRRNAEGS